MQSTANFLAITRLHRLQQWLQRPVQAVLPIVDLLLRIYVAKIFFLAGLSKMHDWDMTISLFTDEYQVPWLSAQVAAFVCTAGELVFPVMLVAGLFRQFAALGLLAVNVMAVISYYHVLRDMPVALQDHLEWGLMLLLLASLPLQFFSIDFFFSKLAKRA
jgi:putative oxidoreductase